MNTNTPNDFPESAQELLTMLILKRIEDYTGEELKYSSTFKDDQLYLKLKGYIGVTYRVTPKGLCWWKENVKLCPK